MGKIPRIFKEISEMSEKRLKGVRERGEDADRIPFEVFTPLAIHSAQVDIEENPAPGPGLALV